MDYDGDDNFDDGYKKLKRQLEKEKAKYVDDEDHPNLKRQKRNDEEEIGRFIKNREPTSNFVRRPEKSSNLDREEIRGRGNNKQEGVKDRLMKTLLKFKKNKKPTTSKGGMATVKIDF